MHDERTAFVRAEVIADQLVHRGRFAPAIERHDEQSRPACSRPAPHRLRTRSARCRPIGWWSDAVSRCPGRSVHTRTTSPAARRWAAWPIPASAPFRKILPRASASVARARDPRHSRPARNLSSRAPAPSLPMVHCRIGHGARAKLTPINIARKITRIADPSIPQAALLGGSWSCQAVQFGNGPRVSRRRPRPAPIRPRSWSPRRCYAHFAHHIQAAVRQGFERVASIPDQGAIEALIGAAFWASLRREENYVPRISLAWLAPDEVAHPLILAEPLPLDPGMLAKVAPAVERAGIHLGVSRIGRRAARVGHDPHASALLPRPRSRRAGPARRQAPPARRSGKFVNVAVLEGDQIKIVDEHASSLPDCPDAPHVAARVRLARIVGRRP